MTEIGLIAFVEQIDDTTRALYERNHFDQERGVMVLPIFIVTDVLSSQEETQS